MKGFFEYFNEEFGEYFREYKIVYLKTGFSDKTMKYLEGVLEEYCCEKIIIVSTYSSVGKLEEYMEFIDFVLLDECHHAFSDKREFL